MQRKFPVQVFFMSHDDLSGWRDSPAPTAARDRSPSKFGSMARLIAVNIRNAIILLALLILCIPVVTELSRFIEDDLFGKDDERGSMVNYRDLPWAKQHFKEFAGLETYYVGYMAWRREPFSGSTIEIDADRHIRVTPRIEGLSQSSTFFFGGSTMWGTGATNETTIPAFYQAVARETAMNFAESGWTAHQNLNQFIKLVTEGQRPASAVFYDGANETAHKCRIENDFYSHGNESRLREGAKYKPGEAGYYFRSLKSAAQSISKLIGFGAKKGKYYNCDTDAHKADLVAEALITDWEIARHLADANGIKFYAFLQPIAYLSTSKTDHIDLEKSLGDQFRAVYPIIRAKMKEHGIGIDLSDVLDREGIYFIDFCHVSPNGNEVIAQAMRAHMSP
jgi:hypothetical protein